MKQGRILQHSTANLKEETKRLFFQKISIENIFIEKPSKPNTNCFLYKNFFSKFGAHSRRKSFCFLSKKSRSVHSKFKLSRISFRELAHFGLLNGVYKASW
jgi:ribosomal protein S14